MDKIFSAIGTCGSVKVFSEKLSVKHHFCFSLCFLEEFFEGPSLNQFTSKQEKVAELSLGHKIKVAWKHGPFARMNGFA